MLKCNKNMDCLIDYSDSPFLLNRNLLLELCTLLPGSEVLLLFLSQDVDFYTHRFEF